MNEKSAMILRCVVGAWLVYTGVSLVYNVVTAKPSNMIVMICFGVFFTVFGIGFDVLTIRRYMADMKADGQEVIEESYAEQDGEEDAAPSKRGAGVASVDLKTAVNVEAEAGTESVQSQTDAAGQEIEAQGTDAADAEEEPIQEPAEDTSKEELKTEE